MPRIQAAPSGGVALPVSHGFKPGCRRASACDVAAERAPWRAAGQLAGADCAVGDRQPVTSRQSERRGVPPGSLPEPIAPSATVSL